MQAVTVPELSVEQRVLRYKAERVTELLSENEDFEVLWEAGFLQAGYVDTVEIYAGQCGYEGSIEEVYAHLVATAPQVEHDGPPIPGPTLVSELERLRLAVIRGGIPVRDAILRHLEAFRYGVAKSGP